MSEKTGHLYSFGPFRLDTSECLLILDGKPVLLAPKAFEALLVLVENAGHLVDKDDLMRRLWPNTFVEEANVAKHVSLLRKILSEATNGREYIETIPKRGYRFVVDVKEAAGTEAGTQPQVPASANLIGKKLTHYRVLEVLGGGGMGVVYKAEDLKLGRPVALKFLPEELAANPVAIERFEREARAASALDHPNICAIYEFGEHEGQPFIVMQYLEGETLRDRLAAATSGEKAISVEQVLDLAVQVAAGLEAAHQKGIIHRDIKPANIFITHRGEAKILDFGLAKLVEGERVAVAAEPHIPDCTPSSNSSATPSLNLTRTGDAMGTASYMSPEQVRGEKLDARTDLFSFGLVMYEMATGQQAFAGDTPADIHDAILHRTTLPARQLNSELPAKLEAIIARALEKVRDARYQEASELRADLSRLKPETTILHGRWPLVIVSVFVVLVITFAIFGFTNRHSPSSSLPELKLRQLTSNSSENPIRSGTISPDGKYLAYGDLRGIHIKAIETGATQDISRPEALTGGTVDWAVGQWFPDGTRFLANWTPPPERYSPEQRPSAWTVSMLGGAPQKLRDDAFASSISPDGSLVAFTTNRSHEIWLMGPNGEEARKLFETDGSKTMDQPQWTSNGRRLGYLTIDKSEIAVETRDLQGGPPIKALPKAGESLMDYFWLPDGRMIYVVTEWTSNEYACNSWEMRIDNHTGRVIEKPRRITNWTGFCLGFGSLTADGKRLTFLEWAAQFSVYVAKLEANGTRISTPRRLTLTRNKTYPSAWTADSKAVVFSNRLGNEHWGIYKQFLDKDTAEPIITALPGPSAYLDANDVTLPRTSADGTSVLYTIREKESASSIPTKLMRVPVEGGPAELVTTGNFYGPPSCATPPATLCAIAEQSQDRKQLIFTALDSLNGRGQELTRFDINPNGYYVWSLSPDGARIAVLNKQAGPIYVLSLVGKTPREVRVKGWPSLDSVTWAANGAGFFVSSPVQQGSVLLHADMRGNSQVLWKKEGVPGTLQYAIPSPDGRHLAISNWTVEGNIWMMENF
jgi:serine/threonine protein kinase